MNASERRFFIPEVIQSSMMDCGPAALKAMLNGFDIPVNYGRLREACQTDVDGTSIDTMEDLAIQLGLDAEQLITPVDHVLIPEAKTLPALIVVKRPNGSTHFIIIWRLFLGWAQIMDPSTGRHWVRTETLSDRFYQHSQAVSTIDWLEWASSEMFINVLRARLLNVCIDPDWAEACLKKCTNNESWYPLASLDAATRMVTSLINAKGIKPGKEAGELINRFFLNPEEIPKGYWSVHALPEDEDTLLFKGAVIIHSTGLAEPVIAERYIESIDKQNAEEEKEKTASPYSPELSAAMNEEVSHPERHILSAMREDGFFTPTILIICAILAGVGITLEVLVLRNLMEINQQTQLMSQQLQTFGLVILFFISLLILEWPLALLSRQAGKYLEVRLRLRFLKKLPHLEDRYFHSRLTSDMIQRAYDLREISNLPNLGVNFLRILAQIILITIGLTVIYPEGTGRVIFSCAVVILLAFLSQPWLQEKDMQFRTHVGSLSRFYLDALLGIVPIRSHGATQAIQTQHERLLLDWFRTGRDFFRTFEYISLLNFLISTGLSIWLVHSYLNIDRDSSVTLVLLYWLLQLPQLGNQLAESTQQYPTLRNRLLRLLEPLSAPDESHSWYSADQHRPTNVVSPGESKEKKLGVSINFHQVNLILSGREILQDLNVNLASGEHVAIVGKSGAGKSSLVGLLLGWHRPATGGTVWVDGELLHGSRLEQLRQESVWVDPEVQLWNRSLADNINYGKEKGSDISAEIWSQSELLDMLQFLPDGDQTILGENAGLLSGGEGQRVRLGRGLNRNNARLVILDEPFRGLTRHQRSQLLGKIRLFWQNVTLLFISHDVSDTKGFDRTWVVHEGRLVEDAPPHELAANPNSHYSQLLEAEQSLHKLIWNRIDWTKLYLENGQLTVSSKR
ncbi:MAG: ATP-binding cassette domain-containing protein [Magnetococcales bacterium]|nr:ATP-binding cassette domain-containing protein [Magnetococcales bacterium]